MILTITVMIVIVIVIQHPGLGRPGRGWGTAGTRFRVRGGIRSCGLAGSLSLSLSIYLSLSPLSPLSLPSLSLHNPSLPSCVTHTHTLCIGSVLSVRAGRAHRSCRSRPRDASELGISRGRDDHCSSYNLTIIIEGI